MGRTELSSPRPAWVRSTRLDSGGYRIPNEPVCKMQREKREIRKGLCYPLIKGPGLLPL